MHSVHPFRTAERYVICHVVIMKQFIILLAGLAIGFSASAQSDLTQSKSHGKVSLQLPEGYYLMSNNDIVEKFGMHEFPTALYADPTSIATISINEKKDTVIKTEPKWNQGFYNDGYVRDLSIEKEFKKSSFRNEFSELSFISDTAYVADDWEIMFFEFTGTLDGVDAKGVQTSSEVYNLYFYALKKKRSYLINISCPIGATEQKKTLKTISESIKFK